MINKRKILLLCLVCVSAIANSNDVNQSMNLENSLRNLSSSVNIISKSTVKIINKQSAMEQVDTELQRKVSDLEMKILKLIANNENKESAVSAKHHEDNTTHESIETDWLKVKSKSTSIERY